MKTSCSCAEVPGGRGNVSISSPEVGVEMPRRPGFGTQGTPIMLLTNHHQVKLNTANEFYQYDVAIADETGKSDEIRGPKAKRIWEALIGAHRELLGGCGGKWGGIAYDYSKILYSATELVFGNESKVFEVKIAKMDDEAKKRRKPQKGSKKAEGEDEEKKGQGAGGKEETFQVTITKTATRSMKVLHQVMTVRSRLRYMYILCIMHTIDYIYIYVICKKVS